MTDTQEAPTIDPEDTKPPASPKDKKEKTSVCCAAPSVASVARAFCTRAKNTTYKSVMACKTGVQATEIATGSDIQLDKELFEKCVWVSPFPRTEKCAL
ncbi:hypothetical protein BaRGS_00007538 [Batillaria attramentaria]|uniref:Uncharacterized protein n=1 Tax=Batillaria attramentaria TaxID=370345 RepID=A0ABD0LNJ2_9CAEN